MNKRMNRLLAAVSLSISGFALLSHGASRRLEAATLKNLLGLLSEGVQNRPFSQMAAENSNKLKLAKIKNVYQH